MKRRAFIACLPAFAAARRLLAAPGTPEPRLGLCAFSFHQHWKAVGRKEPGTKFSNVITFYEHARGLGADGIQNPLRTTEEAIARKLRGIVERDGAYYEADLRLPRNENDLAAFERDARLARVAGATVGRGVLPGGRRYETFHSLEEFRAFQAQARRTLRLAEPALRKHGLKLAVENHKDHTSEELLALLREISSEWIGALVDTGNNIALLEEPNATAEALAPFALSVHLKDMAVQPSAEGFLLSEVPAGTGALDLSRIAAILRKANPAIVFNLEMATRDPLRVPCLAERYFATFPERKAARLAPMLEWVKAHPPKQPPPSVSGKPVAEILAEEERNNRDSLAWMNKNLRS